LKRKKTYAFAEIEQYREYLEIKNLRGKNKIVSGVFFVILLLTLAYMIVAQYSISFILPMMLGNLLLLIVVFVLSAYGEEDYSYLKMAKYILTLGMFASVTAMIIIFQSPSLIPLLFVVYCLLAIYHDMKVMVVSNIFFLFTIVFIVVNNPELLLAQNTTSGSTFSITFFSLLFLLMLSISSYIIMKETTFFYNQISRSKEIEYRNIDLLMKLRYKTQKQDTSITSSLFTYPALMAADIILYDADYVPVGDDQKQHLELARTIATRFNNYYGDFFTVPEPLIPEVGARIMDLQNPEKKMSKSEENDKGYITMFDDAETIRRKIRSAVTDSVGIISFNAENQPGLANLLTIYASVTDRTIDDIVLQYRDSSYKEFKDDLAEIIVNVLIPIQANYQEIIKSEELQVILDKGRDIASDYAFKKMRKCKKKLGLVRK